MAVVDTRMKDWIREGREMVGIFVSVPAPALVEMAGFAGFDFVVLDNEHGPGGIETTENLLRAAKGAGVLPIVRVCGTSPQEILRTLDIGASGVQVPQVDTAAMAAAAVRAAKYPPQGGRGVAFSNRAAGYGLFGGPEHLSRSNDGTVVIIHLETVESLRNLDDLLGVPGIDVYFIGPTDLSTSMGFAANLDHPEVVAAIEAAVLRITAAGKTAGILTRNADDYRRWADLGVRYLAFNLTSLVAGALSGTVAGARR